MSVPQILGIGSCRIFRPLRHLHEGGLINLLNHQSHQWFTHTAAGAMQYANLVTGRVTLPQDLRPAVLESEMELPDDLSIDFGKPDLVIVEVSTLKEHVSGDYILNAHKVYGLAVASGVPYRPVINGITEDLPDDHLLRSMVVHYAAASEVENQLMYIQEVLSADILTVDHLYTESSDGLPIPERVTLSKLLRSLESTRGMAHYSTKDAIVSAGLETALEDQNHYRRDFEPEVAKRLYSQIKLLSA